MLHTSSNQTLFPLAQCCGKWDVWWLSEICCVGQLRYRRCATLLWRLLAPCHLFPSAGFQNCLEEGFVHACTKKNLSALNGKSAIFPTVFYEVCAQEFWLGGGRNCHKKRTLQSSKKMARKQLIGNSLPYSVSPFDLVLGRLNQGTDWEALSQGEGNVLPPSSAIQIVSI